MVHQSKLGHMESTYSCHDIFQQTGLHSRNQWKNLTELGHMCDVDQGSSTLLKLFLSKEYG